jgi:hypothetical protein
MGGRIDVQAGVYEDTTRKTVLPKAPPKVVSSGIQNVLNNYRSYTYNFTLAALNKADVNNPEKYENSALNFVIAKTGGKGTSGITTVSTTKTTTQYENNGEVSGVTTDVVQASPSVKKLVSDFNEKSPGRFDLFIDNVDIDAAMAFSKTSGTTLPTSIKFEVIEPYSINGFIEALHVSAVAAGYLTYSSASFILKMEFVGYPDSDTFTDPEVVQGGTRYFVFGFSGLEVSVTEKGTRYRCSGLPFAQKGYGQSNILKQSVNMSGKTVKEILTDLMKKITEQVAEADNASRTDLSSNEHDTYHIKFPSWSETTGFDLNNPDNEIAKSDVVELLKDNQLYKFDDPATTTKENALHADAATKPPTEGTAPPGVAYTPRTSTVQFANGANIHDCISSLIRDSKYIRDIYNSMGQGKNPDENGMVDYFLITLNVENSEVIDKISRRPYQKFTYVVTKYKVYHTTIPAFATDTIDAAKLKLLSLRDYNYIYTGKNLDIIDFNLNFNTLYFEAIPRAMGNNDIPGSKTALGNSNTVDPKLETSDQKVSRIAVSETSGGLTLPASNAGEMSEKSGGSAGQPLDDPYSILAKNMHEAIINSNASLITGEITILGDPFYIATGGIGNTNPKPKSRGITVNGEATQHYGSVFITITFRNPIDIGTFESGGLMYFQDGKVPFGGVYRVLSARSSFKDGQFKQTLSIARIPGQIDAGGGSVVEDKPADAVKTSPDKNDQAVSASLPAVPSFNLPAVVTNVSSVASKFSPLAKLTLQG